jgi:hypothetical protein
LGTDCVHRTKCYQYALARLTSPVRSEHDSVIDKRQRHTIRHTQAAVLASNQYQAVLQTDIMSV